MHVSSSHSHIGPRGTTVRAACTFIFVCLISHCWPCGASRRIEVSDTEQGFEGDLYPGLFRRLHLSPSIGSTDAHTDVVPIAVTSHSWFGLVHGLPIMFVRPSAKLSIELRTTFKEWIVTDRAPVWKNLPENPFWTGPDKTSLTSKYTRYNLVEEALRAGPKISSIGRRLKHFLGESLVELITLYPDAIEAMGHEADKSAWKSRIGRVDRTAGGHPFSPFPIGVHVQSWMNLHTRVAGNDTRRMGADQLHDHTRSIHIHHHDMSWHGFMPLNAAGTNTTFIVPPHYHQSGSEDDGPLHRSSVAFNIKNSDGVLVMLCGGVQHGVPPAMGIADNDNGVELQNRVSVAFDFMYSATVNGNRAVSHPGATPEMSDPVWPSSSRKKVLVNPIALDGPENVNTVLLTPVQLENEVRRVLRRRGGVLGEFIEPLTLDHKSVADAYQLKNLHSLDFAGLVDMEGLVGKAPKIHWDEL